MKFKFAWAAMLIGASLLGTLPAKASSYNFTFVDIATGGTVISGSGIFDVTGGLITGFEPGSVYNGNPITSLIAPGGYLSNDNAFNPAGPAIVDFSGVSFQVAGTTNYNLYYNPGGGSFGFLVANYAIAFDPNTPAENIAVNFQASQTPLPSTWLMLLSGFLGLGFFAYQGSKRNVSALAA